MQHLISQNIGDEIHKRYWYYGFTVIPTMMHVFDVYYIIKGIKYNIIDIWTYMLVGEYIDFRKVIKPENSKFASQHPCPENWASLPSILTLWWFNPLAYLGWKRPLIQEDMWDTQTCNSVGLINSIFSNKFFGNLQFVPITIT